VYHNLFWKNGVLTNLTLSYSTNVQAVKNIGDMDVVGDDVYFCGITKIQDLTVEQYEIAYWKNGVKTIISSTSNLNGPTTNIKVLNNDVYVRMIKNGLYGYYKNSIYNETPNAPSSPRKGFAVNNNEIYTIYQTGNMQSTIYNITNNTFTPIGVNSNAFYTDLYFDDNNNIYYIDMSLQGIYKNGIFYYGVNTLIGHAIYDFKIHNNNLYTLELGGNFGTSNIVVLNGVNILVADSTEQFSSLFIVQN
jgi:predicted nucleic-acid-binding Zn-ribbon protein